MSVFQSALNAVRRIPFAQLLTGVLLIAGAAVVCGVIVLRTQTGAAEDGGGKAEAGSHADHADHKTEENPTVLHLSAQNEKNVGLTPLKIELQTYQPELRTPGMIVEQPGKTESAVTAPIGGVVTRIHIVQGQAVAPSQLLFELRMTHEELVTAQGDFLTTAEEKKVVEADIKLLNSLTQGLGVQTLRLRRYELQKLEANLRAQRQRLLLHGLSAEQVDSILQSGKLVSQVKVDTSLLFQGEDASTVYHVEKLMVRPGQHVETGETMSIVSNHKTLLVEGSAFEDDAELLHRVVEQKIPLKMLVQSAGGKPASETPGLQVLYVDSHVETGSRAMKFFVKLPNQLLRKPDLEKDQPYLSWKYKVGQRVDLLIPVKTWHKRMVVPVSAVVVDGADRFVFRRSGRDHDVTLWKRTPVSVEHRDQRYAVLGNDGSLFPGDVIAKTGAYQMHLALKNQSGGGVDPHAGHSH